jgi:hypothetical protein
MDAIKTINISSHFVSQTSKISENMSNAVIPLEIAAKITRTDANNAYYAYKTALTAAASVSSLKAIADAASIVADDAYRTYEIAKNAAEIAGTTSASMIQIDKCAREQFRHITDAIDVSHISLKRPISQWMAKESVISPDETRDIHIAYASAISAMNCAERNARAAMIDSDKNMDAFTSALAVLDATRITIDKIRQEFDADRTTRYLAAVKSKREFEERMMAEEKIKR